ncbi:MAG: aminoacyl-tRNA hydrolase [Candidatus Staskawiczbacteria bacterium]|nr:aminoacyl-tRNA hydrolase [Candidatus Staskawiczbacteria bacterium]
MIIIVGLGNPGKKFEDTRHNVGFWILDKFMKNNNFPAFEFSKKFNALISEKEMEKPATTSSPAGEWCGGKVILVKPQAFMNNSGKVIKKIISTTKDQISLLVVVHDDIDLPLGKIKIVGERGSAGHKGVESIIKNVGNKGLIRIRVGIEPQKEINARQIVLKKFNKKEKEIMNDVNIKTVGALDFLIQNGLEKAMNEYNR